MSEPLILQLKNPTNMKLVMGKPSTLSLDLGAGGGGNSKILIGTTEYWESKPTFVPSDGMLIIYSDRNVIKGIAYPGIKVGNGTTVVGDLPFLNDDIQVTYEDLPDKPSINDITLVGNTTITELLAGGLIIDGGNSSVQEV